MAAGSNAVRQAAVIPVQANKICLVTSSSGKRWVIPKGRMEPGKTAGEIALQEAWEEAGLVGILTREPLGSYLYEKLGSLHYVVVFLMTVTEVSDEFPENTLRERCWVKPAQALIRIEDRGLQELIRSLALEPRQVAT